MGYSEVLCHICGVSFNIGRMRTQDEPRQAAWTHYTPSFVDGNGQCNPDSGCKIVRRRRNPSRIPPITERPGEFPHDPPGDFSEPSDAEDAEHEYQSSAGDEPLEYDSNDESDNEQNSQDPEPSSYDEANDQDAQNYRRFCNRTFYDTLDVYKDFIEVHDKFEDVFVYANEETRSETPTERIPYHLVGQRETSDDPMIVPAWIYRYPHPITYREDIVSEHIPGPGCAYTRGYNGHNISAEEMKACMTLQCLVQKNEYWSPEPDDEEFESTGRFFLSGISDHMPSRDCSSPTVYPARHRTPSPNAENCCWDSSQAEEMAMPFHPHCFEVWKRASLLRQSDIDVEGLTGWWIKEMEYEMFDSFPRHPAVDRGTEQEWQHNAGDEFLVANPLIMPRLPEILQSAMQSTADFDVRNSAFAGENTSMQNGNDTFDRLPEELCEMVLSHLGSKDIANLRLASATFRHLPMTLWYGLLQKEMPWLWEAWSDLPYSFWSTTTKRELEPHLKRIDARRQALDDYFEQLNDEMPETRQQNEELREFWQRDIAEKAAEYRKPKMPIRLDWATTDWHHLYLQIKRYWKDLKGLQNRERIWTDCEEIVKRVEIYREQDLIPVEDVRATVQAAEDRARAESIRRREEHGKKVAEEEAARAQAGPSSLVSA